MQNKIAVYTAIKFKLYSIRRVRTFPWSFVGNIHPLSSSERILKIG